MNDENETSKGFSRWIPIAPPRVLNTWTTTQWISNLTGEVLRTVTVDQNGRNINDKQPSVFDEYGIFSTVNPPLDEPQ